MTISYERRKKAIRYGNEYDGNEERRRIRNRKKRGIIEVPNGPTIRRKK